MTPNQTVVYAEALSHHATTMGWNQGTKQIPTHQNSAGSAINLIKCYGQIDKSTLKASCERFCRAGGVDAETCAKKNNTMMASCLSKSLTVAAQARLLICCNEYTFNGVKYAPLMYKVIMKLATIDTVTTTQALQDNLQNLGTFSATVNGNIAKNHGEFDKNYSQLIAQDATLDDPIGILFKAYNIVPCTNFKKYIGCQYEDYLDGRLTGVTHKTLMTSATRKYGWFQMKGIWGAKYINNKKITAMAAEIQTLKGHLKANKKHGDALKEGDKCKKRGNSKTKNNNKNEDKAKQKEDEEWEKVPPKDGEKKSKEVGKYTYHWCVHHMAWCMHLPADCRLGKEKKQDQQKTKPSFVANSATYAAAAASMVDPHFQALIATLGHLQGNNEDKE
jgi:hypothetical protein